MNSWISCEFDHFLSVVNLYRIDSLRIVSAKIPEWNLQFRSKGLTIITSRIYLTILKISNWNDGSEFGCRATTRSESVRPPNRRAAQSAWKTPLQLVSRCCHPYPNRSSNLSHFQMLAMTSARDRITLCLATDWGPSKGARFKASGSHARVPRLWSTKTVQWKGNLLWATLQEPM